jgi:hypothetical protein
MEPVDLLRPRPLKSGRNRLVTCERLRCLAESCIDPQRQEARRLLTRLEEQR